MFLPNLINFGFISHVGTELDNHDIALLHTCPDLFGLCLYILVEGGDDFTAGVVRETCGST